MVLVPGWRRCGEGIHRLFSTALDRKGPGRATLFAFFHHALAFTQVSAVAFILIRQEVTRANALRLLAADAVLGVSATLLLTVGLLRVFYFEKGAAYYFSSHAFRAKLSVFILACAAVMAEGGWV